MNKKNIYIVLIVLNVAIVSMCFIGCHSTKVASGQRFYLGQKTSQITYSSFKEDRLGKKAVSIALNEVESALKKPPNASLFGSAKYRWPWSNRLGIYNVYKDSKSGFGHWLYTHFATPPITLMDVQPSVRQKIGTNLLHDYGFFRGKVDYQVIPLMRDSTRVKVKYFIRTGLLFRVDTLVYYHFPKHIDSLLIAHKSETLLTADTPFSVETLGKEKLRVSNLLRENGYFYFRSDYLTFQADTFQVANRVKLRLFPKANLSAAAYKKYRVGRISINLFDKYNESLPDSSVRKDVMARYNGRRKIRMGVLSSVVTLRSDSLYSLSQAKKSLKMLLKLGAFRYVDDHYILRDSLAKIPTLDVNYITVFDKLYELETELNVATKSTGELGPGTSVSISKNNLFGGGERLTATLGGNYEWQASQTDAKSGIINSYELMLKLALSIPDYSNLRSSSTSSIYLNRSARSGYYRMMGVGASYTRNYQIHKRLKQEFTPLRISYNHVSSGTKLFNEILDSNPSLALSMQDQYIPAIDYRLTFDDSSFHIYDNQWWWQFSFTSSGNLINGFYSLFGKDWNGKGKELMGTPFAQFAKVTAEIRRNWVLDTRARYRLASRIGVGVVKALGNSTIVPYSEEFYVGGANSVRAFTVRSIGPGTYVPNANDNYSYLQQVGDIKFDANLEFRFPVWGHLNGAVFLDAGNVWLLKKDQHIQGGQFNLSDLPKAIAVGTGLGLRYDLDFFVLRFDWGIGLHTPYDTGKSGFYNINSFGDALGYHFAIGYPF